MLDITVIGLRLSQNGPIETGICTVMVSTDYVWSGINWCARLQEEFEDMGRIPVIDGECSAIIPVAMIVMSAQVVYQRDCDDGTTVCLHVEYTDYVDEESFRLDREGFYADMNARY